MKTVQPSRRFSDGRIDWHVPGAPHAITYRPNDSRWNAPSLSWPTTDPRDGHWTLRAVRLDWHKGIAKAELRKLLATAVRAAA